MLASLRGMGVGLDWVVNWTRPVVVECVSSTALAVEEEAFQLSEQDALQRRFLGLLSALSASL